MSKNTNKATTDVSDEQVKKWQEKHGQVYQITVDDAVCFLRKPDRKILSAVMAVASQDPIKYNEMLLANCWLGGDERIKNEDDYFFGASAQLAGLLQIKQGELKKL